MAASEPDAKSLQVERGAPLINLESTSFLETGIPVEYFNALHRGDRARFEIELVGTREHPDSLVQSIARTLPDSTGGVKSNS